jgi:hypothetical protein
MVDEDEDEDEEGYTISLHRIDTLYSVYRHSLSEGEEREI